MIRLGRANISNTAWERVGLNREGISGGSAFGLILRQLSVAAISNPIPAIDQGGGKRGGGIFPRPTRS
jgi:hypothetical protein